MGLKEKITDLRRGQDLSQERLAERIGVSRQAVAKWESGESLPEIEHLILLGKFFSVSIDALLADRDACAAAGEEPIRAADSDAIAFLCRAKRSTYAGYGSEVAPTRPGSHDLTYREGEYLYHDTYLGGERFGGEEALWLNGEPIWAMNYCGRTLHRGFSGDFLKEALSLVAEDSPFRGPAIHRKGDLSYHCMVSGGYGWFRGTEEIFRGSVKTYECVFHGGTVS